MLKEVERAERASSTRRRRRRRRDLQPLAELCRDEFASAFVPMDRYTPLAFRCVEAFLTLNCISCSALSPFDLSWIF